MTQANDNQHDVNMSTPESLEIEMSTAEASAATPLAYTKKPTTLTISWNAEKKLNEHLSDFEDSRMEYVEKTGIDKAEDLMKMYGWPNDVDKVMMIITQKMAYTDLSCILRRMAHQCDKMVMACTNNLQNECKHDWTTNQNIKKAYCQICGTEKRD